MARTPEVPIQRSTVQGIRDDLRKLWASESMSDEAVIRARTHNLVVLVADEFDAEQTTRNVIERTGERPGRVIIIDIDNKRTGGLDAWVTTYCRTVNRHQICGEMITLSTAPGHHEELHSTVISLLAPDLPVYLWWTGVPAPNDHLFEHLAPEADRIFVDSDTFADAAAGLARVAELQETYRIGDLAWARLSPWRQMIAQVWDVSDLREALDQVATLDIHHAAAEGSPRRAALLLGWLATRLGWAVDVVHQNKAGYAIEWHRGDHAGKSRLAPSGDQTLSPGEINQIDLSAGSPKQMTEVQLKLHPKQSSVETQISAGGQVWMKNSCLFRQPDDAMALAEELDLGYDPSYADAVKAAAHILQLADQTTGKSIT